MAAAFRIGLNVLSGLKLWRFQAFRLRFQPVLPKHGGWLWEELTRTDLSDALQLGECVTLPGSCCRALARWMACSCAWAQAGLPTFPWYRVPGTRE